MNTGTVICLRMVALPRISSPSRECPYAPITDEIGARVRGLREQHVVDAHAAVVIDAASARTP